MGWFYRRLESLLDNVIFAGVVTVGVIGWALAKTLPGPVLFIIALATFALILFIFRLILSFVDRKRKKDAFAKSERQTISPHIQFYEQRQSLAWFRDKIHSARIIWGAYLIGASINSGEVLKSGNFRRLVLLHPDSEAIKAIQVMESDKSFDSLQKIIRELTDSAKKKNCNVRWCRDITYSLLTIGNPPDGTDLIPPDDMWVIVETYVPGIEAEKRPSFLVERSNHQRLADSLLVSFNKLWEHSELPD